MCVWEYDIALIKPYHTHQVLELPPIAMDVTLLGIASRLVSRLRALDQSARAADMPQATDLGSVPSWGNWLGHTGTGRRIVQTFCASVLQVPIRFGPSRKSWTG